MPNWGPPPTAGPSCRRQCKERLKPVPEPAKRSATRTETPEELAVLAGEIRDLAAHLDRFYERCEGLSKPIYMTGWTRPLGTVGGLGRGLERWAEVIDAEVAKPF